MSSHVWDPKHASWGNSKDGDTCIFSRKMEAIVIISFKYFCNTLEKMSTNIIMLPKWDVVSMNKQTRSFSCGNHKTLTHLELNFKWRRLVVDEGFENWVLRPNLRIFSSLSWGIFGHEMHLDQSRDNENIWWIIGKNNYAQLPLHVPVAMFVSRILPVFSRSHRKCVHCCVNSNNDGSRNNDDDHDDNNNNIYIAQVH